MEIGRLRAYGYRLDESDPDILVLRREDGAFVAAFSARGATRQAIRRAAEEDLRATANGRARQGRRDQPEVPAQHNQAPTAMRTPGGPTRPPIRGDARRR